MKRTVPPLGGAAVEGALRALQHFDPLEIEQDRGRGAVILVHAIVGALGEVGVVEIDAGGRRARAADDAADREGRDPRRGAGVLGDVQAGDKAGQLRHLLDPLLVQRLLSDRGDRQGHPVDRVGLPRSGDHDLFEADGVGGGCGPACAARAARALGESLRRGEQHAKRRAGQKSLAQVSGHWISPLRVERRGALR